MSEVLIRRPGGGSERPDLPGPARGGSRGRSAGAVRRRSAPEPLRPATWSDRSSRRPRRRSGRRPARSTVGASSGTSGRAGSCPRPDDERSWSARPPDWPGPRLGPRRSPPRRTPLGRIPRPGRDRARCAPSRRPRTPTRGGALRPARPRPAHGSYPVRVCRQRSPDGASVPSSGHSRGSRMTPPLCTGRTSTPPPHAGRVGPGDRERGVQMRRLDDVVAGDDLLRVDERPSVTDPARSEVAMSRGVSAYATSIASASASSSACSSQLSRSAWVASARGRSRTRTGTAY